MDNLQRVASAVAFWSVLLCGVCGSISSAFGFVRTKTCDSYGTYRCEPGETPRPIAWPVRCVKYRVNEKGSSDLGASSGGEISERLRTAVRRAFQTWNAVSCADFQMVEGPLTSNTTSAYEPDAGFEGNMNLVVWRDEGWPHGGEKATVFALTQVRYDISGRIHDADIEFNSATYDFEFLSESRVGKRDAPVDFLNSLTHEVGHFLGLAHTKIESATMYGEARLGEVKKRTLEADDEHGVCAIYPERDSSLSCDDPDDFAPGGDGNSSPPPCGCATRRYSPDGSLLTFVAALPFLVMVRRLFRRRRLRD